MTQSRSAPEVGVIMGSDSDLPVMQAAADALDELRVSYELTIVSAHRTPKRLFDYAEQAAERGLKVIIAGAGGAAHLPGMVAAITPLPVIGVPVKSASLSGQDSLLSIVQMPPGVPVATVAINGARNAGLLAAQILGVADLEVRSRVDAFKRALEAQVLAKAERVERGEITAETVREARAGRRAST
jgi:5-(carboxyamino)imidazole ribonucleotide mutase